MAESAPQESEPSVDAGEDQPSLRRALRLAAKIVGLAVAGALLAAVSNPVWVTENILEKVFGRGLPPRRQEAPRPTEEFMRIRDSATNQDIEAHLKYLSSLGSRVPGYEGSDKAFEYLKSQLIGLQYWVTELDDKDDTVQVMRVLAAPDEPLMALLSRTLSCLSSIFTSGPMPVPTTASWSLTIPTFERSFLIREEEFDVTVPIDEGARLSIVGPGPLEGRVVALNCLWPNNVQTPCLSREGITGPLVDAGSGHFYELKENVDGAIALMDFGCDQRYVHLRMLGAKAIIFYTPEPSSDRADTEASMNFSQALDKMMVVPADIPRYYVDAAGYKVLRQLLDTHGLPTDQPVSQEERERSRQARQVRLQARMRWQTVKSKNLFVELPGSMERLDKVKGGVCRDQRIMVSTYYDSISVVPAVAPGAENACGAASLVEVVKALAQWKKRKYTVAFLFTGGHFQGMAGINAWLYRHARKNRTFASEIEDRGETVPFKVFIGVDLSSRNDQVAAFSEGAFTNPALGTDNYRKNALAPFAKTLEAYHDEAVADPDLLRDIGDTPEQRYAKARYFNAIIPPKRSWKNFMLVPLGFEHEAVHRVGGVAFTLATPSDWRALVDTPLDDFAHLRANVGNVTRQARTITALLMKATADPNFFPESKLEMDDAAGALEGRIVWFDRDVNFFVPKAPVSEALVTYQMNGWTEASCGGVRTLIATMTTRGRPQRRRARQRGMVGDGHRDYDAFTNEETAGEFFFDIRRVRGDTTIEAYAFDEAGQIVFAPDLGQEGDKNYPMLVPGGSGMAKTTEVLFPCRAISIFEIVDSRRLSALDTLTALTPSDSEPQWYGTKFVPNQSTKEGRVVPAAVVFVRPDQHVKLFMSTGLYGIKYLLTGADEKLLDTLPKLAQGAEISEALERQSRGQGYNPAESVIFHPFYKAARDMWIVDDVRIKRMARYGIRNDRLDRLHKDAREALVIARKAYQQDPPNYPVYVAESRRAWGLEARGYPDVKSTAGDSVNGIIFYFMLLLPFSFFCERLLFGFKDIRARMGGVAGIFAVVFILLHLVHPAFKLTTSPYIILLAFVVLVLGSIVLVLLMGKFSQQVQKSKRGSSGLHEVDVGRISATTAAINLGVDNLRKRKVRTTLTAVTLILLTFTVLSFTSIQTSLKPFVLPHRRDPLYDGALIRERSWQALQASKLDYVNINFGISTYQAAVEALGPAGPEEPAPAMPEDRAYRRWKATVIPRAWIQAKVKGDKEFIQILNKKNGKSANASGLMGFTPDERNVLKKADGGNGFKNIGLVDDRGDTPVWFEPEDRYACFLSNHMASEKLLDIKPEEIARARLNPDDPGPQVWMYGHPFVVKGIFDGDKFAEIKDLDGESLTPVDFVKEASEVTQAQKEDPSRQATQPIRQFEHIDAKNCAIIPYHTARDLGGLLASIALVDFEAVDAGVSAAPGGPGAAKQAWLSAIDHFMDRVALTVFVGDTADNTVNVWSSISRTGVGRVSNLLVPIVIAAFIVLNTMIGAVYERAREIGIYSAIGLTPRHIAALFLAESAVYATVGAVVGYLIGQILVRVLVGLKALEGSGMTLNYSSLSAIWSTVVVMVTTFLSTLFPARKAAELSVPDVTRRWKFPEPAGDDWFFDFPFTLSGAEVPGIYSYLTRVFESYGEGSVGGFLTEDVRLSASAGEPVPGTDTVEPKYTITMKTWLAPYDLGISQSVRMDAIPTGEANIYRIAVCLHRESGDVASWRRINRGFLNVLRKRFLVWRTMAPGLREEYLEQGRKLTELAAEVASHG